MEVRKKFEDLLPKSAREDYITDKRILSRKILRNLNLFPTALLILKILLLTVVLGFIIIPLWKIAYPELVGDIIAMIFSVIGLEVLLLKLFIFIDLLLFVILPIVAWGYRLNCLKKDYFDKYLKVVRKNER